MPEEIKAVAAENTQKESPLLGKQITQSEFKRLKTLRVDFEVGTIREIPIKSPPPKPPQP